MQWEVTDNDSLIGINGITGIISAICAVICYLRRLRRQFCTLWISKIWETLKFASFILLATTWATSSQAQNNVISSTINNSAMGLMQCKDIDPVGSSYQSNLERLARLANLEGGYISRYEEDVIGCLCNKNGVSFKEINELVDKGYVRAINAESIARVLGKDYTAPPRSASGLTYERVNKKLSHLGLCLACASNIADAYIKDPHGEIAGLADKAMAGDTDAIQALDSPSFSEGIAPQESRSMAKNNTTNDSQSTPTPEVSQPEGLATFSGSIVNLIISGFIAFIAWIAIVAEVSSGRTNKVIKEGAFLQILLCALLFSIVLAIAYFSSEDERAQNINAFWLFIALGILYFLPTILAFKLHRKNRKAICALNIFLGWSGLGWIGALVWSFVE